MTSETEILHTTINLPYSAAYAFAQKPENFPKWAAGMSSSLHHTNDDWVADTPAGKATIRFTEPNEFGVLDHWVHIEGSAAPIYIPLRMLANGDATEVELVLIRQPGMTDEIFENDKGLVRKDLASLKALLERTL